VICSRLKQVARVPVARGRVLHGSGSGKICWHSLGSGNDSYQYLLFGTDHCGYHARLGVRFAPGARFAKHLTTVLRSSYNNAKVTFDLRWMSNLTSYKERKAKGTTYLQYRKIARDSVRILAYDIPKRNLSTL